MSYLHRPLVEEHRRAQEVKAKTKIVVCLGNPPYDRQQIRPDEQGQQRKGGWVRFGEEDEGGAEPILEDFLAPVREAGKGLHLKNLYNDYVYFWRWALWKVFENPPGPGIVSFITASSYLRGQAFSGMRKVMREVFDDLWILDLEGDQLGPRKTENVFAIRTPVAIAVGVRYGEPQPATPASVHYTQLTGSRETKLATLARLQSFDDLEWHSCYADWTKPFLPEGRGDYFSWPKLTDLFPWQQSGCQFKRTWPIGESRAVLEARWRGLASAKKGKDILFKETRDRKVDKSYQSIEGYERLAPIRDLSANAPSPPMHRYGYRSFDRQWVLLDPRLGDFIRLQLWTIQSGEQIYFTSLLRTRLGEGPAATVTADVPDLHHFTGSYGGKDVVPLWRDAAATEPNVTSGLLAFLSTAYDLPVRAEDFAAYVYSLLATPAYAARFSGELATSGPRLPLTKSEEKFLEAVGLGRRLLFLHTYGERSALEGQVPGRVPPGRARCAKAISEAPEKYPESFSYLADKRTLRVGDGEIRPVTPEVWEFTISSLQVVGSWLAYRMRGGAGKSSSPLDEIRPERWTAEMTEELLRLLWILEATVEMYPALEQNLERIVQSELFEASELPEPTAEQRKPPKVEPPDERRNEQKTLF